MLTSVSGLPRFNVSVGAPLASDPPETLIVAVFAVSLTSSNIGAAAGNVALTSTPSLTPFTESVAEMKGRRTGLIAGGGRPWQASRPV